MSTKKPVVVLIITGVIVSILIILAIVLAFTLKPKKEDTPSTETLGDISLSEETSTSSSTEDWEPNHEANLLGSYSENLYGTGVMQVSDATLDEYNRFASSDRIATDEELHMWINEVRDCYRQLDFNAGAEILKRNEQTKVPYTDTARQYIMLYYDIGVTSSISRYQADESRWDGLVTLISNVQDAETFVLAALSCRNSYKFYLDKDAVYLSGLYAFYGQGTYLDSSNEMYDYASQYIVPDAIYCFPIQYNNKYQLYCYVVHGENSYYILTITNPDGSKTTPYELSGGIDEEITTENWKPVSTNTSSVPEQEDKESSIFHSDTSYNDDLIRDIINYVHSVSTAEIASITTCSDNDCTILMSDGTKIYLSISENRVISAQEDNQDGALLQIKY